MPDDAPSAPAQGLPHGSPAGQAAGAAPDPAFLVRRRWIVTAVVLFIFMSAVEATIVATAMPTIIAALGGFQFFTWVFAVYLITSAVTTPIYGRLADLYGRKRVLLAGTTLFLASSAACGFAGSIWALIAFRALQGLGAGALMPVASTIVGDLYPPAERARLQGSLSAIWGIAAVLGPVAGAALISVFSWASVFWVNIPLGILAMIILATALHENVAHHDHKIDYAGSGLMIVATCGIMFAAVQASSFSDAVIALLLAASGVVLALFFWHERRTPEPMIPLALWGRTLIAGGNVNSFCLGAIMMGVIAFLPAYVQGVMGRSALVGGFVLTAVSIGWSASAVIGGRLLPRTTYRRFSAAGSVGLAAGAAMLILLQPAFGPWWAGTGALLIGVGVGLHNNAFTVAIQSSVAWNQRGSATSSIWFTRTVGQSIGAALFGGVVNATLAARAGAAGDVVGRLVNPASRAALDPARFQALAGDVGVALHQVYLINGALVLVVIATILCLPRGIGPARHG